MRKSDLRTIQRSLAKRKVAADTFGWEAYMAGLYPLFVKLGQERFDAYRKAFLDRDLATAQRVAADLKIDCSLEAEAAYLKRTEELFDFPALPKRDRDDKDLLGAKIGGG